MGGQFAVGKIGMRAGLSAYDIVALRFGFAAACLAPILVRAGLRDMGATFGLGWTRALILTLVAGGPYALLMIGALEFAPAAHGAMIVPGLTLILSTLGGRWLLGEQPSGMRVIGIGIITLGLLLIGWQSLQAVAGRAWLGDLMFVVAGTAWAFFTVLCRLWTAPPLIATAAISVLSLPYLVYYAVALAPRLMDVPVHASLVQGVYHGILQSVVAMVGYSYCVKHLGAGNTAMGNSLVPVLGTLVAIPILGEWPSGLQWAGLALVVTGMLAANLRIVRMGAKRRA